MLKVENYSIVGQVSSQPHRGVSRKTQILVILRGMTSVANWFRRIRSGGYIASIEYVGIMGLAKFGSRMRQNPALWGVAAPDTPCSGQSGQREVV